MYHSLYFTTEDNESFGDYHPLNPSATVFNTYGSWGLIAEERPVITMPPVKTDFQQVEFVSGSKDNTTAITKVPVYNDRTGSITFYVTEPKNWPDTLLNLAGYLHGKRLKMWLEDDPEYYYIGRWAINQWGSSEKFSTIQLDYTLYPYKISKLWTTDGDNDWLWDSMNFDNGHILQNDYVLTFDTVTQYGDSDMHLLKTWSGHDNFGHSSKTLSQGIVTPIITWTPSDGNNLNMRFVNTELETDVTTTITSGAHRLANMQFSNLTRTNAVKFYAKGVGTISFKMRRYMF